MSTYGHDFEGDRRISYEGGVMFGDAVFVPRCECGRYVKPDPTVQVGERGLKPGPNATCRKCGRVEMYFEGFL
jgi:hypothetical protein